MLETIDPEILALCAAAAIMVILNRFKLFFILSAKGNLLWTGIFTFITVDLFLRRYETILGIENTVWLAACVVITIVLIAIPDLIPSLFRRIPL